MNPCLVSCWNPAPHSVRCRREPGAQPDRPCSSKDADSQPVDRYPDRPYLVLEVYCLKYPAFEIAIAAGYWNCAAVDMAAVDTVDMAVVEMVPAVEQVPVAIEDPSSKQSVLSSLMELCQTAHNPVG